jgi:hypothetical protein
MNDLCRVSPLMGSTLASWGFAAPQTGGVSGFQRIMEEMTGKTPAR